MLRIGEIDPGRELIYRLALLRGEGAVQIAGQLGLDIRCLRRFTLCLFKLVDDRFDLYFIRRIAGKGQLRQRFVGALSSLVPWGLLLCHLISSFSCACIPAW